MHTGKRLFFTIPLVTVLLLAFLVLPEIPQDSVDSWQLGFSQAIAKERKSSSARKSRQHTSRKKESAQKERKSRRSSARSRTSRSGDEREPGKMRGAGSAVGAAAGASLSLPSFAPPVDTSIVFVPENGSNPGDGQLVQQESSQGMRDSGTGDPQLLNIENDSGEFDRERRVKKGLLMKGEDVNTIFANTESESRRQYLRAAKEVFSRGYQPGHFYSVVKDGAGHIKRFEYEIDTKKRLVVEGDFEPVARLEAVDYKTVLVGVIAIINDNIFQAVADAGESPQLATMLSDVFGSEINFLKDVSPGDFFTVIVEKKYQNGNNYGYGRIVAATFTAGGNSYEVYLFPDKDGKLQYYNEKGENTRKAFLQSPLAITRITSTFTKTRKHPILGYSRPHEAVDYAAPVGTPVKAVGDGTVQLREWAGQGGNQIVLAHAGGLESIYSHLSGYARGLRVGQQVSQGQVIGFVGSTGLSTGPHLDFRLRQNGKNLNPAKVLNPRGEPVHVDNRKAFTKYMNIEKDFLKGHKPLSEYSPDLFDKKR